MAAIVKPTAASLKKLVQVHGFVHAKLFSWTGRLTFMRRMSPNICACVVLNGGSAREPAVDAEYWIAPVEVPDGRFWSVGLGFNIALGSDPEPDDAFFAYVLHRAELILESSAGMVAAAERELENPVFKVPGQRVGWDGYAQRWRMYRTAKEMFDQDPAMEEVRAISRRVASGKGKWADITAAWQKLVPRMWKRPELAAAMEPFQMHPDSIERARKYGLPEPDPARDILVEYSYIDALIGSA